MIFPRTLHYTSTGTGLCSLRIHQYGTEYVVEQYPYYEYRNSTSTQRQGIEGFQTHTGKVISHTGIKYNDEADEDAKDVVHDTYTPDITFSNGGRQQMGLRTWPEVPGPPSDNDAQADMKRR